MPEWLPIVLSIMGIVNTISLFWLGFLMKWHRDHDRDISDLRAEMQEKYARTPEVIELKRFIEAMRTELLAAISSAKQDFANQVGPLRNEVSGMSKIVNQMVGAMAGSKSHLTEN